MSHFQTRAEETSSKEKAEILLRAAVAKKAMNPVLIDLKGLTSLTDYFLIVSARSTRHARAVAEAVLLDAKKQKIQRYSAEGVDQGTWALLDYGDVVVHVFHTPVREFYDLEGLWAEAPREPLPPDILEEMKELEAQRPDIDEESDES
ncbi:MAG: ribosome silencing factor [Deltaproteobacteria bacterium]|nr:ribosome silencing factor [Deltaproteobacteria bacterium]